MSVEHTPLSIEPEGTALPIGVNTLNGQSMDVYSEPFELPCDPAKKAICESHLESGVQGEMLDDFWMAGCDFDKSLKEGLIRIQFSCPGRSGLLKRCRLTLTQYDKEGNKLNDGTVNRRIES